MLIYQINTNDFPFIQKHFLATVGGFTLRGTVKDFVRMTFSDAFVAINLTWCLGTSKIHFRDSQISKTFFGKFYKIITIEMFELIFDSCWC